MIMHVATRVLYQMWIVVIFDQDTDVARLPNANPSPEANITRVSEG